MDLVGAPHSRVVVTMDHVAKDGSPKVVDKCKFPLTGKQVVDMIITDKAVFEVDKKGGSGLTLTEIASDISVDELREITACDFTVADTLKEMDADFNCNSVSDEVAA